MMIVVFLHLLLFFLPFYLRIGVILITIIGYALLCGMDSSVFRAVLMGGLSMIALFWGREVDIRRLMSISAIVMLLINPYFLVYDVGFLLSYSALAGIVYFEEVRDKEDRDKEQGNEGPGERDKEKESETNVILSTTKNIGNHYILRQSSG